MADVDDGFDAGGKGSSVGIGSSGEGDAASRDRSGGSATAGESGTPDAGRTDGGGGSSGTGEGPLEDGGEPARTDAESGVAGYGSTDGGNRVRELSFVAGAFVVHDVAIVIPSEARAGDLAILVDSPFQELETPTPVFPDGWNTISNVYVNSLPGLNRYYWVSLRTIISFEILQTGDAGKSVTGMAGTLAENSKTLLVFRGDKPISSVTVKSLSEEGISGSPAEQMVTASTGNVPLVVIASYRSTGGIQWLDFIPPEDGEIASSVAFFVRYKIFNFSPSDVSVDFSWGNVILQSFYLEVF
jgi:hypothetical protein